MLRNDLGRVLKKYNINLDNPIAQNMVELLELSAVEAQFKTISDEINLLPQKISSMINSGKDELEMLDSISGLVRDIKQGYMSLAGQGKLHFYERIKNKIISDGEGFEEKTLKFGGDFRVFNSIFGGLSSGVYIMGGKPNQGKTTFGWNFIYNLFQYNRNMPRVKVYSCDDNERRTINKVVGMAGKTPQNSVGQREHSADAHERIKRGYAWLTGKAQDDKLDVDYLFDVPTIEDLEFDMLKEWHANEGKVIFFIDSPRNIGTRKIFKDDNAKGEYLAMKLKEWYLMFDVPIISTFELKKEAFNRRPKMEDLIGSAKLAYVTDVGILLSAEDEEAFNRRENMTIFADVDKNKNGDRKGIIKFTFNPLIATFMEKEF